MIRPRLTIRRLMLGLVLLAIVLRLVSVTIAVLWQPNAQTLSHLRRFRDDGSPFVFNHGTTPSQYWSEWWRRFVGVRWPGGLTCPCKAEHEAEMGRPTIDVDTSHDMDAMDRKMMEL